MKNSVLFALTGCFAACGLGAAAFAQTSSIPEASAPAAPATGVAAGSAPQYTEHVIKDVSVPLPVITEGRPEPMQVRLGPYAVEALSFIVAEDAAFWRDRYHAALSERGWKLYYLPWQARVAQVILRVSEVLPLQTDPGQKRSMEAYLKQQQEQLARSFDDQVLVVRGNDRALVMIRALGPDQTSITLLTWTHGKGDMSDKWLERNPLQREEAASGSISPLPRYPGMTVKADGTNPMVRTIIGRIPAGLDDASAFYRSAFAAAGWRLEEKGAGSDARRLRLDFKGPEGQCSLSFTELAAGTTEFVALLHTAVEERP